MSTRDVEKGEEPGRDLGAAGRSTLHGSRASRGLRWRGAGAGFLHRGDCGMSMRDVGEGRGAGAGSGGRDVCDRGARGEVGKGGGVEAERGCRDIIEEAINPHTNLAIKSCVGVEAADLGGARGSVLLLVAIERGHDGVCCSEDGGDDDYEDGGKVAVLRMEAGSRALRRRGRGGAPRRGRGIAGETSSVAADLGRAWRV
jgi:hypothetical protein